MYHSDSDSSHQSGSKNAYSSEGAATGGYQDKDGAFVVGQEKKAASGIVSIHAPAKQGRETASSNSFDSDTGTSLSAERYSGHTAAATATATTAFSKTSAGSGKGVHSLSSASMKRNGVPAGVSGSMSEIERLNQV